MSSYDHGMGDIFRRFNKAGFAPKIIHLHLKDHKNKDLGAKPLLFGCFNSVMLQSIHSGSSPEMSIPNMYLFSPVLNEKVIVNWNDGWFDQGLTPGTTNIIDFTVSYSQWSV